MGPGLFVLALIGCGDGETMCREVRIVNVSYPSEAACATAIVSQLEANMDLAYPILMARCQPRAARMARR